MEQSQASAAIESGLVKEPSTMQSCQYHLLGDFIDGVLLVFGSIDLITLQRPLKKVVHLSKIFIRLLMACRFLLTAAHCRNRSTFISIKASISNRRSSSRKT